MSALATVATPHVDWPIIAPVVATFGAALFIVIIRATVRTRRELVRRMSIAATFIGLATAAAFVINEWRIVNDTKHTCAALHEVCYVSFNGAIAVDGLTVFAQAVVLLAATLATLLAIGYVRREGLETPEFLALLLLATTGMMVIVHANDLILVFVALEVFSIALYILSAFDRRRGESQEAGLKYFVLGAFSSAIFLYGVALVYGATGTTSLAGFGSGDSVHAGIAQYLAANPANKHGLLLAGIALLLVGLGFKVAAVPFHMWAPDVYQGAPTPITAFMAAATKMAAFAALLRIFAGSLVSIASDWRPIIYVLAVASLLVGTIAAAIQTDVKRMLAYSSISHAGYVLIGVQVANAGGHDTTVPGTQAALFYLLVYAVMAIGAFGVVQIIEHRGETHRSINDYRGLSRRAPVLAGLLTLFLLAQAGVPLTGGFVAKLLVFRAAEDAGQYMLALTGMLASVIGAYVYLRLVLAMYGRGDDEVQVIAPTDGDAKPPRVDWSSGLALTIAAVGVVVIGILPGWFISVAHQATQLLASAH
jgi:NADH-quinone oxidoreductase subunit N